MFTFTTDKEKALYKQFTGRKAPACLIWTAPYLFWARWQGITIWRLVVVRDRARLHTIVHEMVHVEQFKWLVGYFKYFYYLAKHGYRQNPMEVEAYDVGYKVRDSQPPIVNT